MDIYETGREDIDWIIWLMTGGKRTHVFRKGLYNFGIHILGWVGWWKGSLLV
jgi:hypothetical protein